MRNRPRRGSRTTVTRTASLITFIKVRERQLRGGISARRKDRLDRVELTDDPRLTANRGRQRTNVGTKEVGAKKRDGNGQEEGFRPLESKFSMIGKCYRSFRHFFLSSIANVKYIVLLLPLPLLLLSFRIIWKGRVKRLYARRSKSKEEGGRMRG